MGDQSVGRMSPLLPIKASPEEVTDGPDSSVLLPSPQPRSQSQPTKRGSLSPESALVQGGQGRMQSTPRAQDWDPLHLVVAPQQCGDSGEG